MSIVDDKFAAQPKNVRLAVAASVQDAKYTAHEATRKVEVYGFLRDQSIPHGEQTESEGTRSVGHKVLIREVDQDVPLTERFADAAIIFDAALRDTYITWYVEHSDFGKKSFLVNARPKTNTPAYAYHTEDPFHRNKDGFLIPILDVAEALDDPTPSEWAELAEAAKGRLGEGNYGKDTPAAEEGDMLADLL